MSPSSSRPRRASESTLASRPRPGGGALQRLGGLLGRALAPARALVGASRGVSDEPGSEQLCIELRARLLGMAHEKAAQVMQHLVLVHDVLARHGWRGVASLPGRVLDRAVLQAEILASEERSPALEVFIDKLRIAKTAAMQRDADDAGAHEIRIGQNLEVTESTHAEFDVMERQWAGTVPSRLDSRHDGPD